MNRPNTCANLIKAIYSLFKDKDTVRLSRAMGNVIVAQMLPDGVVKGGSSLMFRYGGQATRYTRDMDTARMMELGEYLRLLETSLTSGWNGFTGKLVMVTPPKPKDVPPAYIMMPFDIKLNYCGRPWQTIRIEIGHNEIGDADEFEEILPEDLAAVFETLSFPRPEPIHVMRLSHQIAQKLHAVSEAGSERAHDLVDLQLIVAHSELDMKEVRSKCRRLFDYRRMQAWPPTIVKGAEWDDLYQNAKGNLPILQTVDEAIEWANKLIVRIESINEGQ